LTDWSVIVKVVRESDIHIVVTACPELGNCKICSGQWRRIFALATGANLCLSRDLIGALSIRAQAADCFGDLPDELAIGHPPAFAANV